MKGTLYISKSKNIFTISPAGIRASISFQVSYPAADSLATEPFVFVQDASHKQTILTLDDVEATADFYELLGEVMRSIKGNWIAEDKLEGYLIEKFGMKVIRK